MILLMANVIYDPVVGTLIAKPNNLLTYYDSLSYYEKSKLCIIINNIIEFENNIREDRQLRPNLISNIEHHLDLILYMIKYLPYDECVKYVQILIKYYYFELPYIWIGVSSYPIWKNIITNKILISIFIDIYIIQNNINLIYSFLRGISRDHEFVHIILFIFEKVDASHLKDELLLKVHNDNDLYQQNIFKNIVSSVMNQIGGGFNCGFNDVYLDHLKCIFKKLLTSPVHFSWFSRIKETSLIKNITEFTKLMKIMTANTGISFKSLLKCLSQPTIKMMHIKTLIKYTMKLNIIMTEDMFEDIYTNHTLNLGFIPPVFSPDEKIYI